VSQFTTNEETRRLKDIAADSLYAAGANTDSILHSFEILRRHLSGKTILEMGPAEGVMSPLLYNTGLEVTFLEGAALFCESLRKRFPQAKVVNNLFEEFQPEQLFDNVILGHVLEHVHDPVDIIRRAKQWTKPGGMIFCGVPNARSLHRQAAVIMGLLKSEYELNETDIHHGHRRVFSPESLRNVFVEADIPIEVFGGYWMKPVSNRQIQESWTPEMIKAFMILGERYPDIAGEIYVVARVK
jgi:2-polyprenyl-3-methyl-5-hydroxy-6-metoxy-1,4-benzoquinol methylase